MQRKLNPIQKNGDRNLFCTHYNDCLDHAAKRYWKYWTCYECKFKRSISPGIEGPITAEESVLYYRIPEEIYQKVI